MVYSNFFNLPFCTTFKAVLSLAVVLCVVVDKLAEIMQE